MKRRYVLLMVVFILLTTGRAWAEDDFQAWEQYSLKVVDTKHVDWTIFGDLRMTNDAGDVGIYLVSQKIKYDFLKNLSFGTNYTYIQYKSNNPVAGRSELKFQHRAELEINPYYQITGWLKVDSRNRIEFRWIEDKGTWNTRLRHRLQFTFPFKTHSMLKDFYVNNEFFYDIAEHEHNENRAVPIGVTLQLEKDTDLKLYYMIQSQGTGGNWHSNHILGSLLSAKF